MLSNEIDDSSAGTRQICRVGMAGREKKFSQKAD